MGALECVSVFLYTFCSVWRVIRYNFAATRVNCAGYHSLSQNAHNTNFLWESASVFLPFFLSSFSFFLHTDIHSCSSRCPQSSLSLNRFTLKMLERPHGREVSHVQSQIIDELECRQNRGRAVSVKRTHVSSVEWDCGSCFEFVIQGDVQSHSSASFILVVIATGQRQWNFTFFVGLNIVGKNSGWNQSTVYSHCQKC